MIKEKRIQSGYKSTKLGFIPNEWAVKSLEEVASINMGQSPDSNFYNENGEGLPLIQGNADMKERKSIIRYYTSQLTKVCDEGDFILSVRAPVGSIGVAGYKSCIGRGVCSLKPKNIVKEYLYQILLNSELSWKKLEQGSTFTAIGSKEVKEFKIVITEKSSEQTAIANLLSTWDKAIQLSTQLLEQKQLRKKWLMQMLLTGKKRLKGFEKSRWHLKSLEEVADFRNGKAHENEIDKDGKYIVVNSKFISTNGEVFKSSNSNISPLFKDEIVMVMSDIPNGKALAKCFYIMENDKYTLNQRICAIISNKETNSKFLYYLLNRNNHYLSFNDGVSQTNLKKEDVLECPLLIPSEDEQKLIVNILEISDKEIELLKSKLDQLKEQKKGLMQILLTGKKRLKFN